MKTRIISGLVMTPLVLVISWLGDVALYASCLCLSLFAVREFFGVFDRAASLPDGDLSGGGARNGARPILWIACVGIALLYGALIVTDLIEFPLWGFLLGIFLSLWFVLMTALCLISMLGGKYALGDAGITMAGLF
jgi:hypothetical protein